MVHMYSSAALERRRQRATDRGYLRPRVVERGFALLRAPVTLIARARQIVKSLALHDTFDIQNGFHSHYARNATRCARISEVDRRRAFCAHQLANKAKHGGYRPLLVASLNALTDPLMLMDPWRDAKPLPPSASTCSSHADPWHSYFANRVSDAHARRQLQVAATSIAASEQQDFEQQVTATPKQHDFEQQATAAVGHVENMSERINEALCIVLLESKNSMTAALSASSTLRTSSPMPRASSPSSRNVSPPLPSGSLSGSSSGSASPPPLGTSLSPLGALPPPSNTSAPISHTLMAPSPVTWLILAPVFADDVVQTIVARASAQLLRQIQASAAIQGQAAAVDIGTIDHRPLGGEAPYIMPLAVSQGVSGVVASEPTARHASQCVRGCGLLAAGGPENDGTCDMCEGPVPRADLARVCAICDFWVCCRCFARLADHGDGREGSVSSSEPTASPSNGPKSERILP